MKKQNRNCVYKYWGKRRFLAAVTALLIAAAFTGQTYSVRAAQTESTQTGAIPERTPEAEAPAAEAPISEAPVTGDSQTGTDSGIAPAEQVQTPEAQTGTAPEAEQDHTPVVPAVTTITPLSDTQSVVFFDYKPALSEVTAQLPAELTVTLEGSADPVAIPVTWSCSEDYENTALPVYQFNPVWDTAAFPLSSQLDIQTSLPLVTVNVSQAQAEIYLIDPEKAKSSLESLAKSKNILALIYLCDSYEIKQAPGQKESSTVTADIGQSVLITGVGEDSEHNIWYQVKTEIGGTAYTGFIEREYLAYSDEDFINWERESTNISNYMLRSTSPAKTLETINGVSADIARFPDSYQNALTSLKSAHPNWIFVPMNTGVNWNTAILEENRETRSLIHSSANAAWKKSPYDSSWSYPTDGILAYYMDPRNFLTENHIFQFELLTYNATYHTESAVQNILNGTFMTGSIPDAGQSYSQAFCSIGRKLNVSPFHLASRVRQEQGSNGSALISGTYPGYERLYNYFNIGATGKGNKEVIENGLKKASSYGWTSHMLSLEGGADIISKSYIQKGQDTLYLQKFNVNKNSPYGLYNHQYMQNIAAPSSEAVSVKKAYTTAGSFNNSFVFRIPVYDSMPYAPCSQPASVKEIHLSKSELTLKTDKTETLSAAIDGMVATGSSVSYSSSNTAVATVNSNGTVTAISPGTAVITCSSPEAADAVCTVTVEKGTPAYTMPVLNAVIYDSGRALNKISLPAGWTWDNPAIVPTVINSGYPATYTPADTGRYHAIQQIISLTVKKSTPAYQLPAGLQSVAGNTLASLKLPAGFKWDAPGTVLKKTGSYPASYNPDEANYQTVNGISIPITVTASQTECTTHSYGEWISTSLPTCTAAGVSTHYCLICGSSEASAVPALNHSYNAATTKPATETESGIRTLTCSLCGDTYTETIDKLPSSHTHSYSGSVTTAPECTVTGIQTYTCSCGDSYKESISAAGHSYTSKVTKEATEQEAGSRTYTCSKCSSSYTETIPKLPAKHTHSYQSSISRQASCTEKGIKTYICSCGDSYTEDIAALGHDMSDGKCRRCGHTEPGSNATGGNADSSTDGGSTGGSTGGGSTGSSTGGNTAGSSSAGNGTGGIKGKKPGTPASKGDTSASDNTKSGQPDNSVTIDMKATSVLYEETLSSIRGKDIDVILSMGNSISWTINGSNIVADEANGIDMGAALNTGNIPGQIMEQAKGISESNTVIELTLSHSGPFDFMPELTISTASDNAGRLAALFYYNPDSNELEFTDEAEVTETGDICFTFTHASDYAVIISDSTLSGTKTISAAGIENMKEESSHEGSDESPAEDGEASDSKGSLNPAAILIVVIILLIIIAIGCTAFFMLRSKDEDHYKKAENPNEADDAQKPESDGEEAGIEYTIIRKNNNVSNGYHDLANDDDPEYDDSSDYDDSPDYDDNFDDDEYDGFE